MKILGLQVKDFNYKLHHPTVIAEEDTPGRAHQCGPALILFLCAEEGDENINLNKLVKEIRKRARKANVEKIVVNPFAHLSDKRADGDLAKDLTNQILQRLKESWEGQTEYTSFGWYKEFQLDVLGGRRLTMVFIGLILLLRRKTVAKGEINAGVDITLKILYKASSKIKLRCRR